MMILVFTEGTIIRSHQGSLIGGAARKLQTWYGQGAEILYLTSRRTSQEVEEVRRVLKKYGMPDGQLLFRKEGEEYKDIAERTMPDVLVEDDCESIGGEVEMTHPHIRLELRTRIKSIVVREYGGIDHLPDRISDLLKV